MKRMISIRVSKKELESIYASLSWYLSERRHSNREDNTEFDLFIERIYKLLKDEKT
jgi:hypothetical protein